jgi:o-succinylbenzoate---CoA ligase
MTHNGPGIWKTLSMNEAHYSQLTINGETFNKESLTRLVHEKLRLHQLPDWEEEFFGFLQSWFNDSEWMKVATSGSTGKPKRLIIPKTSMVKSAIRTGRYLNLQRGQSALLALPVRYIAGQMMVVRALVLGLDLYPVLPSSNPLNDTRRNFDFAALTPMQVISILESENGSDKVKAMHKLIIGGGTLSKELMAELSTFENQIWATYGMTETLTHVAMQKLTKPNPTAYFEALPGIMFSTDQRGCLVIRDTGLQIEELITNDLVNLISNTAFEFIGRFDHVINTGGVKVSPESIEKILTQHLINKRFIVTGVPDKLLGIKLVLVVEGEEDGKINLQSLKSIPLLKKHEIPKKVIFMKCFPETENGKIIRSEITDLIIDLESE